MTKLYITPLDLGASGSYRVRSRLFAVIQQLEAAQATNSPYAVVGAFTAVEKAILPRLRTDDGTPVDEVLDQLSANEFDALLSGIMGAAEGETVPPENASN